MAKYVAKIEEPKTITQEQLLAAIRAAGPQPAAQTQTKKRKYDSEDYLKAYEILGKEGVEQSITDAEMDDLMKKYYPDKYKAANPEAAAQPAQAPAQAPAQQAAPQTTAQAVAQATQPASASYSNAANLIGQQRGSANPQGTGAGQEEKPNQGMYAGVSDATKAQLEKYQQGYQQSDVVTQAQAALANIQNAKPQGYESKYGEQLDQLLQQITNPEKFNYEFNGDNLFKAYSDLYDQKAQQANLNAQGAAAALTGGYGNSYAESVGQEAYQQQMMELLDKGLEMRNTAYQAYLDEQNQRLNQYGVLNAAEQAEYGRYRDTLADWQREEEMAYNREFNERQLDYNRYMDQLNYYTGLAQIENQAWNSEEDRREAIREFNLNYNETLRQNDIQNAQWQDTFNWQVDTEKRNFDENVRQYEKTFEENARQFDLNLQLGYDTLDSNERIAAGHDAASVASAQISADASMYSAKLSAQGKDKDRELDEKKLAMDQEQREWERTRTEKQDAASEAEKTRSQAESKLLAALQQKHQPSKATMEAAGWTQEDVDAVLGKPAAGGGGPQKRTLYEDPTTHMTYYVTSTGTWVRTTPSKYDTIIEQKPPVAVRLFSALF